MSDKKTHYRKVFKSDHLGVADLEDLIESGSDMIFTITYVKQEIGVRVAGKKGDHNIAYFQENIKPLVLNAGNSKVMKDFADGSPFVEEWANITIRLYIDPSASFGGQVTGGIRIDPNHVQKRSELLPDTKAWTHAIAAFQRDGNLIKVLKRMDVSEANQKLIMEQASVS